MPFSLKRSPMARMMIFRVCRSRHSRRSHATTSIGDAALCPSYVPNLRVGSFAEGSSAEEIRLTDGGAVSWPRMLSRYLFRGSEVRCCTAKPRVIRAAMSQPTPTAPEIDETSTPPWSSWRRLDNSYYVAHRHAQETPRLARGVYCGTSMRCRRGRQMFRQKALDLLEHCNAVGRQ